MRIAIIGAAGQLGTALCERLGDAAVPLVHEQIELTDEAGVYGTLIQVNPTAVINAAAYNQVDRAEDEPALAFAGNALGPRTLANFCRKLDLPLVHVSTDFVFGLDPSRSTPYVEEDAPGPQSAYAVSKLAGELFVRARCRRHFILRTCGLFGKTRAPGRGNFVETMLRLADERGALRVVNDQRCTPTSAEDLATAIVRLMETEAYGLYHATNSGSATWHEFAVEIMRQSQRNVPVHPITTEEFAARAMRPRYSVLNCEKLARTIGYEFPPWQDALARYLAQRDGRRNSP